MRTARTAGPPETDSVVARPAMQLSDRGRGRDDCRAATRAADRKTGLIEISIEAGILRGGEGAIHASAGLFCNESRHHRYACRQFIRN